MPAPSIARPARQKAGFTLVDAIMTLTMLSVASMMLVAFFTSSSGLDLPVQRLQADKDFQYATENILADYYNNFWRSWNDSPPEGFDVCAEGSPLPTYTARKNATLQLASPLMLFKQELEANASKYGNVTVVSIDCLKMQDTDTDDLAQLVVALQSNSTVNPQILTLTIGK
ncbi:hypothetical protein JCM14635_02500 [Megalodesulfovibrio paquesii]